MDDVYFHTDFEYLQFKESISANVTLPYVPVSYYTWSDGGGCGGGCYITTATVEVMGLDDDCYELQRLRYFRDKHMMSTIDGCRKVDEYYTNAPAIVDRLKSAPDKVEFFTDIFNNFIVPAVEAIDNENYELAQEIYEQGVMACSAKAKRVE
jgi:hypothetical protein